jgi:uncharacterized protein
MKGDCRTRFKVFWPVLATFLFLFPALIFPTLIGGEQVKDLPKPTDYVSDYAHVLSPEAVQRIDAICAQLDHSAANAQIAVVTVHTLDGEDTAEYATDLYHQMGIGKKGEDRGVLLLFAIQDRKRSIKVGYGLEGILNDAKTGDIGRDMVPLLRAQNYDGAVLLGVDQIGQVIADDAKVTLNMDEPIVQPHRQVRHHSSFGGIIFFIILLVFFAGSPLLRMLLGYSILTSGWRGGGGWGGGGGGWGGGDSGGGGFGGFGGGDTGGGGSDGSW